jgi:hypothetical protein
MGVFQQPVRELSLRPRTRSGGSNLALFNAIATHLPGARLPTLPTGRQAQAGAGRQKQVGKRVAVAIFLLTIIFGKSKKCTVYVFFPARP